MLLRKPQKLARLVAGIAADSPIPFTVKLRIGTGEKGSNINILEVGSVLGCCMLSPAFILFVWLACSDDAARCRNPRETLRVLI